MGIRDFGLQLLYKGAPDSNMALWFLLTLFFVKNIYNCLFSYGARSLLIFAVFLFFATLINYLRNVTQGFDVLSEPRYLYNTVTGVCFFAAGNYLKDIQFNKLIACSMFAIHLLVIVICFSFVDMYPNELIEGSYLLWLLSSITGCVIVNNIFKKMSECFKFSLLNYIGINSMTYLVVHMWIVYITTVLILPHLSINNTYVSALCSLLVLMVLMPFINKVLHNKYLCWTIGEIQDVPN